MVIKSFIYITFLCLAVVLSSCNGIDKTLTAEDRLEMHKTYQVHRLTQPMAIDADWQKLQWRKAESLDIRLFMGKKPEHLPRTQAKLLYDDRNIYVIFRAEDRYVRAVATEYHGRVWQDSCVEFFLAPGTDITQGYFNIETNCIGTILCEHRTAFDKNAKPLETTDLARIEIAHSLPRQVIDPEIPEPVTWTLEYRLPIEILEKYCRLTRPTPAVKWRANFYKCAETVSHPHWLTWSFVASDRPNFHLPAYFGTLEFVD